MGSPFSRRNALVGYAVTRFVVPAVKRRMRRKAKDGAKAGVKAVAGSPARVSLVVGAAVGAAGWLAKRVADSSGDDDHAVDASPRHPDRRRN